MHYTTWAEVPDGVRVMCPITSLIFIKAEPVVVYTASPTMRSGWVSGQSDEIIDLAGFVGF